MPWIDRMESFLKRAFPIQFTLFYIFISSGLVINFLQLLSVVLWPFNKKALQKDK